MALAPYSVFAFDGEGCSCIKDGLNCGHEGFVCHCCKDQAPEISGHLFAKCKSSERSAAMSVPPGLPGHDAPLLFGEGSAMGFTSILPAAPDINIPPPLRPPITSA